MTGKFTDVVFLSLVLAAQLAWPTPSTAQQQTPGGNCIACHAALSDERLSAPARAFPDDIHAARGFGCADCHGPGLAGMDPALGFLAKPEHEEIPQFCGRCHSSAQFMRQYNPSLRVDQVAEYETSVHGRRLTQFADIKVATCASCHPAHSIRPPSDPLSSVNPLNVAETCASCHGDVEYMAEYGISTNQHEAYQTSIHWHMMSEERDLSAPTCNDCHGNHGAAPPGVSWVGNVCRQCHAVMADHFAQSRHATTFAMLGVPGCATCHNNHEIQQANDSMLGLSEGAVCVRCHTSNDRGGQTASRMRGLIDSLRADFDSVSDILIRAEQAGMEVSEAQFELSGAQSALVTARAAVHSFDIELVSAETEEGFAITAEAHGHGLDALADLQFRRMGLAVSVTIILVLIAGLYLKLRDIERRG